MWTHGFQVLVYNSLLSLVICHSNCPDFASKSPFKLSPYDIYLSLFLSSSLFSGNIQCSTLILYLPSPNSEISHFSEESMVPFNEKYPRNQYICVFTARDVTVSRPLQKKARKYIYAYVHTHISIYGFTPIPPIPMHCHLVFLAFLNSMFASHFHSENSGFQQYQHI